MKIQYPCISKIQASHGELCGFESSKTMKEFKEIFKEADQFYKPSLDLYDAWRALPNLSETESENGVFIFPDEKKRQEANANKEKGEFGVSWTLAGFIYSVLESKREISPSFSNLSIIATGEINNGKSLTVTGVDSCDRKLQLFLDSDDHLFIMPYGDFKDVKEMLENNKSPLQKFNSIEEFRKGFSRDCEKKLILLVKEEQLLDLVNLLFINPETIKEFSQNLDKSSPFFNKSSRWKLFLGLLLICVFAGILFFYSAFNTKNKTFFENIKRTVLTGLSHDFDSNLTSQQKSKKEVKKTPEICNEMKLEYGKLKKENDNKSDSSKVFDEFLVKLKDKNCEKCDTYKTWKQEWCSQFKDTGKFHNVLNPAEEFCKKRRNCDNALCK